MLKKILSSMLSFVLVLSIFMPTTSGANSDLVFSDMPNDWSTMALQNAVDNGLLKGSNGKILPRNNLTRAEMATIINRAFGAIEKASLSGFNDVDINKWYYDEMAKAVHMRTFIGSGNKLYPDSYITREEAFVVLARAFKLSYVGENTLEEFLDKDLVSSWANDSIASLVDAGYVNGSNGKINPKQYITRAEFAKVMDNLVKNYLRSEGTYDRDYTGNVIVNVPNVEIKDITIDGDLIIGDGVGDGEVVLDSVIVTGRTIIRGGGKNSIIIKGYSNVSNIIVSRIDSAVSVKVQDDADVEVIYIEDGSDEVYIEGIVDSIKIIGSDLILTTVGAEVNSIEISGENSTVNVDLLSNIDNLNIKEEASNTKIDVAGKVELITTAASNNEITGKGNVTKVIAQDKANNIKIETPNTEIVVDVGATGVTGGGGVEINGGTTETNNDSGTDIVRETPNNSKWNVNNKPVAVNDLAIVDEDGTVLIDVLVNDTDEDGDILSITSYTQGTNGTVSQEGDSLRYTPNENYNGVDSFEYEISDGNGGIDTATVTVNVNPVDDVIEPVNNAPLALTDTATVDEDGTVLIDVLVNDTDEDGDILSITSYTQGTNGTVSQEGDSLRYTPNENYNGMDSFEYEISDGNGGIDTATVTVNVNPVDDVIEPVNNAPLALTDTATVDEDGTVLIDVLVNDTDEDGDILSITSYTQGTNGTVSQEGDSLRYTPNENYNGMDSFEYEISDGNGGIATATVNIIVNKVLPASIIPVGDILDSASADNFAVILYTRDGNIYSNKIDSNWNWGTEDLIATGSEGKLAVDNVGKIHVVYTTSTGSIGYRMHDGTNWAIEELILSNNSGVCSKPDIAVDGSGYAHITYTDTMGNTNWYSNKPDIMYATNVSGSFVNEVIYDGYYENLYGSSYIGEYYNKGSFISLDSNDNYYIITHNQSYYKPDMQVPESTYSIQVKSNHSTGSTTSSSTDIFNIYDFDIEAGKVIVLYKHSTYKTSELIISGTAINFSNISEVNSSTVSSVKTDGINIAISGINSNNLQTTYNDYQNVYYDIIVKGTKVPLIKINEAFYAVYTDNADNIIKLVELITTE